MRSWEWPFTGLLIIFAISGGMIFLTSLIAYEVFRTVWSAVQKLESDPRIRIFFLIMAIFVVHIICIWLYALAYYFVAEHQGLGELVGPLQNHEHVYHRFINFLYFSATTYTSLGFGDILPTGDMRMLAGAEVLNGLILIGWSVSLTYLGMERFWSLPHRNLLHLHHKKRTNAFDDNADNV